MAFSPATLEKGDPLACTFRRNPKEGSQFKVICNRTDRGISPKMIVPVKSCRIEPQPLEQWACAVVDVSKRNYEKRGLIYVEPRELLLDIDMPEVWLPQLDLRAMVVGLQDPNCNVLVEGEAGVGKTTLAYALANKFNAKYMLVSANTIKKLNQLTGKTVIGTKGDKMTAFYAYSEMATLLKYAVAHPNERIFGHVEEINRMTADCRDGTLGLVEGKVRRMWLPNGEVIDVPNNIMWFATGNLGSAEFVQEQEDAAYKDRWLPFRMSYMPPEQEKARCLRDYPDCPIEPLERMITVLNKMREARSLNNIVLAKSPSTRAALHAAMLIANPKGFPLDYVLKVAVVNQYKGSLETDGSDAGRAGRFIIKVLENEFKCKVDDLKKACNVK